MTRPASPRAPRTPRRTSSTSRHPQPRRVLVTGADSLIGTRVVQGLLAASCEAVAVARTRASEVLPPGVIRVVAERTSAAWGHWAAGCSAAVHVGPGLGERPSDDGGCHGVGARDTAALIAACQRHGIARVVLVSCMGAAATAASARQRAAWAAEQALRTTSLATTVLRPAWLAAPGPALLARLGEAIRAGRLVVLYGGGSYAFQTVAADDVASVVMRCLEDAATVARTFDLAGGPPVPFSDVVRRTAAAAHRRARTIVVPRRLALPLAAFLQRRPTALLTQDELLALWGGTTVDPAAAHTVFGPLASGLAPTLETPHT